jgi:hypothetical protein
VGQALSGVLEIFLDKKRSWKQDYPNLRVISSIVENFERI